MPSPGLGGSLKTAYVPVPEAKTFILFQWWARRYSFLFCFSVVFFPPWTYAGFSPPPPSPNVLLSLYRQPACCDLWVSTARGSQTGKFPVYTRIPWKMSLVNLFLSLTSSNCEIIWNLLPSPSQTLRSSKGSCSASRRSQFIPLLVVGKKCVIETYFWNFFIQFVSLFVCYLLEGEGWRP